MTDQTPQTVTNHWEDYGFHYPEWACHEEAEFCRHCGRQLVETVELIGTCSTKTGLPAVARYHSCPTWVEGWRTRRWARGWALPGYGHDSHDADNPLSARGYR